MQLWDEPANQIIMILSPTAATFRDARGETGSGSFTVPLTDELQTLLARDLVVKHVRDGVALFAWVIEEHTVNEMADPPTITASGRGLLCWLEWATVYPARGLRRRSKDTRIFGFGAGDVFEGALGSVWSTPYVEDRTAPTFTLPAGWPDADLRAIWAAPIGAPRPADEQAWFYRGIATATGQKVRIDATGDDEVEVWLDDERIIFQDGTETKNPGSSKMTTVKMTLPPGDHWVSVRGKQLSAEDMAALSITNPGRAWVAVRIAAITDTDETGDLILRTGDTWQGTLIEPGWTLGFSFRLMLDEARDRGVDRIYWTGYTFTDDADSNDVLWPHEINRTWPVGTDLLKLVNDLGETGADIWATPDKVLHAAQIRGRDLRAGVRLFPAGNLKAYGVTTKHAVRTVAPVKTGVGWTEVTQDDAAEKYGRAETRIDLTTIDSIEQGRKVAHENMGPISHPRRDTSGDTAIVPWAGATPYKDFNLGDKVTVPDGSGGVTGATVMGVTWRLGEDDDWFLDLDLAQAGARTAPKVTTQRILNIAKSGGAASADGRVSSASK